MSTVSRIAAIGGLAVAQLRHDRTRTTLAVIGVALAVAATVLLAATGVGVVATGQEQFADAGRDLWVTGQTVQFAPGQVGGVENSIYDAHDVAAAMRNRNSVRTAAPLLFQTVYVSADGDDFQTLAAMGVPSSGGVSISQGAGFPGDTHYADGSYDGPMTRELLIDERTAALLGVNVGDTIYVGGTIAAAQTQQFEIVGISGTGSQFLGTPTLTLPLSELQETTGKTETDPATLITITLTDGADPARVGDQLARAYPKLTVRTNDEQFQATLQRQAVVLAGGVSLVFLAVIAGLALTLNVFLSLAYQQLPEYAALRSLGSSGTTITGVVLCQSVVVGVLGGVVGLAMAVPAASMLDFAAAAVTGFEDVVRLSPLVFLLGGGVAALTSLVSGVVVGWQLRRLQPIQVLRGQ
jgi:putative ABC transport system permease protein